MTLAQFVATYNHPNAIILLEGKRKVLAEDEHRLISLASTLAQAMPLVHFRSGNADGADALFAQGVAAVDPHRLHTISPYAGHRKKQLLSDNVYSLEDIDLLKEEEVVYESKHRPGMTRLVDNFIAGKKDRNSLKAAYILRDTVKVLGGATLPPCTVALFYVDLTDPLSGGTGHTLEVCQRNDVPYFTQEVWRKWVE